MSIYSLMDRSVFGTPEFDDFLDATSCKQAVNILVKGMYFSRLMQYVMFVCGLIYLYTKVGRISDKITRDPDLNEPCSETQTIFNLNSIKQQTVESLCDIADKVEFLQSEVKLTKTRGLRSLHKSFGNNAVVAWLLCSTNQQHRNDCDSMFQRLTDDIKRYRKEVAQQEQMNQSRSN